MSERQREIPYNSTFMWNLKYDTNELIYKMETDSYTEDWGLPVGIEWWEGQDRCRRLRDGNHYVWNQSAKGCVYTAQGNTASFVIPLNGV